MKVKNIALNNYRLYKGNNILSFPINPSKNIYLISGQNGFGKTTFLHSLLWCLYGRLLGEIDDSIRKDINSKGGYNSYLQNNLNSELREEIKKLTAEKISHIKRYGYLPNEENLKQITTYSVSIEFNDVFIPSIPCQSLKITRSYDIIAEKEYLEIKIDNVINELSTEIGNDVFINDFILNKDVARFFFFDSEKIVSLAETNTIEEKRKLASAYNEVLGVKKYEDLKKNLENMRLRFRKKSNDVISRNKLIGLINKQNELQESYSKQEERIKNLEESLTLLHRKNDSYQISLLREGNNMTLEELKRLKNVVELTKKKDSEYKQKLKTFLEYAPFAISGKLFLETKNQLEHDYKISKSELNINNQNNLIADITSDLLLSLNKIPIEPNLSIQLQNNIQQVLEKYKGIKDEGIQLININKNDYQEFVSVFNNITGTYKMEFERLTDDYKKNKQILERNSRQISNMSNNENDLLIKDIRNKKNIIEKKISETENEIRSLFESKGNINKELATVNKLISELSKKVDIDDSDNKKDILAEQLINELDSFLYSLKQEKKYSLEFRIKNTLNILMHKEDFIGKVKVQIIEDGIDINLYATNGNLIDKDSLSKGEQQLYATSILKALVDESGIEFPVFIDSPLQKFDKSHSNKIITEFYPSISKQVILFPLLHKELVKEEFEIMKPLINSSYLIMNDNSHSYFKQVDINSLMTE